MLTTTLGEDAVSKESAETLGSVSGVVLDVSSRKITVLQVGKGRKAKVVSWDAISGVGEAAVIVEDDDALRDPNEREQRYVGGDVEVIGGLVLSDLGNADGSVVDVEYDEHTGAIHVDPHAGRRDRLRASPVRRHVRVGGRGRRRRTHQRLLVGSAGTAISAGRGSRRATGSRRR